MFFPSYLFFPSQDSLAQATITSQFQGVISQVLSQPDLLWPRKQSDLQSCHEQLLAMQKKEKSEISLATVLLSGEMAAHSQSVGLSNKSLSCRFVWATKLPCCVVKHSQPNAIAKSGWVHKDWSPRYFRQIFGVSLNFEKSTNIHWLDLPFYNIRMTKATDIFCSPLLFPLNIPRHSYFSSKQKWHNSPNG